MMSLRAWLVASIVMALLVASLATPQAPGCATAFPLGSPVVNADQAVIVIWDAATKTQHFIRRASFKSAADEFGFLVPTPQTPELAESGNDAFSCLQKLTAPEVKYVPRFNPGIGCSASVKSAAKDGVRVLQEKLVAGFRAAVLEANSASALVDWLKQNDYAYSPQIEAWAKPYVEAGWKITALKVDKESKQTSSPATVTASALRMSFQTDRPVFPYREPDSQSPAEKLGARDRLLRIFFVADARYQGDFGRDRKESSPIQTTSWNAVVAWSGKVSGKDRDVILDMLKLPPSTVPPQWWLTEFEHAWPYQTAPGDVYFSLSSDQSDVKRPPRVIYYDSYFPNDFWVYAFAATFVILLILSIRRGRRKKSPPG